MTSPAAERPSAYPDMGQAVLLVLALVVSQFILGIATVVILGTDSLPWFAQLVISIISFGLVISIGLQAGGLSFNEITALRPVNSEMWVPLGVLLAGLTIVLSEADNALRSVWPVPEAVLEALLQLRADWIAGILLGVLMAPVTEEMLFRGLILRGFLRNYPVRTAVVLSSVLFALMHLNPWQFTGAFVFGVLSGWLYLQTGSLLPSLGAHALLNAFGLVLSDLLPPISGFNTDPFGPVEFHPWWFDGLGLALTAVGLILLAEHFQRQIGSSADMGQGQKLELP